jgi:hypothetical protein
MHDKLSNRILAVVAISGSLLLFAGTYLHPMDADPNVPLAAFAEYAANRHWVASHLMQLFGVTLMVGALVLLGRLLAVGPAQAVATVGTAGAIASLAVAAALQAVDGVALKAMVDTWAAASEGGKAGLFHAALAVRQIEIGLASMTSLLFGLTTSLFGTALLIDRRFPRWLGGLAIAGGVPTAIAGVVVAHAGFSELAMALSIPSGSLLLLTMIGLAAHAWRTPSRSSVFSVVALLVVCRRRGLRAGKSGTVVESIDDRHVLVEFSGNQGPRLCGSPCARGPAGAALRNAGA